MLVRRQLILVPERQHSEEGAIESCREPLQKVRASSSGALDHQTDYNHSIETKGSKIRYDGHELCFFTTII